MKKKIYIFIFLVFNLSIIKAADIERRIIIEDGTFYYTTVDDLHQMTTLYKGAVSDPVKLAKPLAIPVGRNLSAQLNPLAWYVKDDFFYGINFIDHSLNDRNESIKQIPLAEVEPWSTKASSVESLIMKSVDYPMYTLNRPYVELVKQTKFLNHFYFDAIWVQSAYYMVISNNNKLYYWVYENNNWKKISEDELVIENFFSLFSEKGKLGLITAGGSVFYLGEKGIGNAIEELNDFKLSEHIIVEDRDQDKNFLIAESSLNMEQSLKEIITKNGIELN
ncbi:hypothetical protein [Crocinitomix algicola]|uniref:hypothetical protein n=1 Tax=Crocinitomix algicola TaxID=1740263 RepID=UPI00082CDB84|nr:hypothetical protein [Crocinitomix algicola]